ncbi:MAG: glycoside hydrolase family 3 C-terminal domain-containing protein [Chloroflexi bacterium]|nr:glycoside hydrolase family 3 C-terminal domain-containing protein [Chloroflexota bacterium]
MSASNIDYRDPAQPLEARVDALIAQMTAEEKISQLVHDAPAIERLGFPAYNYWNEALHGVARAGKATVFPQAIGLAATWNTELIGRVATAISDEGRAKHHAAVRAGAPTWYTGLTFWSPNINIFRDPRWGRGHETYGEDPYLTGRLAVAFIRGLQGDHPRYLKTSACAKHFAVHSGPESVRFQFDARVSLKDLYETYLPAFEAAVREARVENVMGAYNRLNGVPCCANPFLLQRILRDEWGFDGHVGSDCGAIRIMHAEHHYTQTPAESAALALKAGCDLNCGETFLFLREALAQGLIEERDLDRALHRVLRTRFRLGMFDPPDQVPYTRIPVSVVDSPPHRALAREAARQSIVLLKNNGILPLDRSRFKSLLIVGPTAARQDVLLGNYYGLNPRLVTPLEGIVERLGPDVPVHYKIACPLVGDPDRALGSAAGYARHHDVIVAVMGLAPELEGEAGDANASGDPDRADISLPRGQEEFLKKLHEMGKPIILVLTGGSAQAVGWAQEHVDAILCLWYPGEEGGTALADVLFGDVSPAGRLPVTFYRSVNDLPPFEDYAMEGRTYRFFRGEPLYPFGFGLSYTRFAYGDLRLGTRTVQAGQPLDVEIDVTNVGKRASDEVVQLYLSDLEASVRVPLYQLCGFQRIHLQPAETKTVCLRVEPVMMQIVGEDGTRRFEPGRFRLTAGGCSPGRRGLELGAPAPAWADFELCC